MKQVFTIYSGFFLVASIISFFVSLLAGQRRSVKGAIDLTRLMIAAGVWSFFIIFETAALTVEQKVFWAKFEYIGAVSTPVLYLIFVLRFTGNEKFLTRKNILILFLIPVITLVMAFTNDQHNLLWSGFSEISEKTNIMEYYHGLWFWIGYTAYNYLLILLATIFLFSFNIRHHDAFRSQGFIIFLASLCPWISSVVYLTGRNPIPGFDLVPVSMVLSGILLAYAILRTRLFDLVPVAREALVETIPEGILALDNQNRIQDINLAAKHFLGIRGKNTIGYPALSVGALAEGLMKAAVDRESSILVETTIGGKVNTYRIFKQAIKNLPGSRLVIIHDITEQVARQREIESGEERYRLMFGMFRLMADNMPEMLWAKDLKKNYIFTNKAICDNLLHATDTDEPIGKTDLFFARREQQSHPEIKRWHTFGELCQDSDQEVINSGKPKHFDEFGNVRGKFLFLDVWEAPIFDENGVMTGIVGSGRDVTRQKKAELEISRRDELLAAIAKATALLVQGEDFEKSINGALKIVGEATGANRVYIFQNQYAEGYRMPVMSQRYEWSDDTVEPQMDNPYLQNLPYEIACPRWFENLSAGKSISGKVSEFPDSERIDLEAQGIKSILVTPLLVDNSFWGFLGFDDCTRERSWPPAEEQILAAAANTIGTAYLRKINHDELITAKEKAEESDRLKSAFLANMSHEIRTPMNGILGFAELLKEPDLDIEEQQRYIGIIEKSGIRLLTMINDLVDLSKIESGQMTVTNSTTNINEQIDYIYNFFKPEVESKGINLTTISSLTGKDALVKTDREKTYAVLINLVKNAIKFTNHGTIEFGYVKKDEFLLYFVKDTGIGIAKDHQKSVFNRFVQADIPARKPMQGAGLGLSIARAYVEMLGGKIWMESEIGKGSEFYFTIPYVAS